VDVVRNAKYIFEPVPRELDIKDASDILPREII
jgi:hypothetical protein